MRGLSKESAERAIGRKIADQAALEIRNRLLGMAVGAIASIDTPSSDCHISDIYVASSTKGKLTFTTLLAARMLLADNYNRLTTVVMHSNAFSDLVLDGITNYTVESLAGMTIISNAANAMGLRIIVCDDPALRVTCAQDYVKYHTLLLGPDALGLIWHRRLHIEAERRLDFEAPYWRILGNHDFAPHLAGMSWNSAANPSNADLADPSMWDEAYDDHRQVLAAMLTHNVTAD